MTKTLDLGNMSSVIGYKNSIMHNCQGMIQTVGQFGIAALRMACPYYCG